MPSDLHNVRPPWLLTSIPSFPTYLKNSLSGLNPLSIFLSNSARALSLSLSLSLSRARALLITMLSLLSRNPTVRITRTIVHVHVVNVHVMNVHSVNAHIVNVQ